MLSKIKVKKVSCPWKQIKLWFIFLKTICNRSSTLERYIAVRNVIISTLEHYTHKRMHVTCNDAVISCGVQRRVQISRDPMYFRKMYSSLKIGRTRLLFPVLEWAISCFLGSQQSPFPIFLYQSTVFHCDGTCRMDSYCENEPFAKSVLLCFGIGFVMHLLHSTIIFHVAAVMLLRGMYVTCKSPLSFISFSDHNRFYRLMLFSTTIL